MWEAERKILEEISTVGWPVFMFVVIPVFVFAVYAASQVARFQIEHLENNKRESDLLIECMASFHERRWKEIENPRCEKCKYWDIKTKTGNRASCRRYPPTSDRIPTFKDDFCGEYVYNWERNENE